MRNRSRGWRRLLLALTASMLAIAPTPAAGQKKPSPPATARESPAKTKPAKPPRRGKRAKRAKRGGDRTKEFDFTGIDLVGRLRSPQLLYFLDRASQELELASLKRRSFIPEMVRSLDEEAL